ncbi:hypothetical protein DY000_02045672 [Brassica cretica]|uniref:Uncharacterized protein n=1 Tax=Brassica cretica TaxID=69181 RepID=A0ABQ7EX06_BRACR|nr:hypothetical protein DY000_02045672 [Brassica cretica]
MAAPHFTQIETTASSLNPLMYSFLFSCLLSLSLFSFISATYFLLKASRRRAAISSHKLSSESETKLEPSEISESAHYQTGEDDETRCAKSRLYELLLCDKKSEEESDWDGDEGVSAKKKKRKRRGKKKKKSEVRGGGNDESGGDGLVPKLETKPEFVGEFANCLIEAKNELQNKSEVIKRKYSITKALLFKADRSSFDRLRQQVLEISASMELKEKSSTELDSQGDEVSDISFEELLEQEKKDSFWSVTLSLSRKLISIKMEDCEPAAGHELLIEYVLVLP